MKVTVIKSFRDGAENMDRAIGDIYWCENMDRAKMLKEKGYVVFDEPKKVEPKKAVIDITKNATEIKEDIKNIFDIAVLEATLADEEADKDRKGVINAINERIEELR